MRLLDERRLARGAVVAVAFVPSMLMVLLFSIIVITVAIFSGIATEYAKLGRQAPTPKRC